MACRGTCTGVQLCAAAIDCIGFAQDAGIGCAGLPPGTSRLQINAAGILEICSNVGGVCSCDAVVSGTDTLVNNGDGTFTHTALDGTPEIISVCEMLCDNPNCFSTDDCNGLVCGADGLLFVNNDIFSEEVAAGQGQVPLGIPGAPATITGGAWQELGNDATATITNPSLCNDMRVCINVTGVAWGANNLTGDNDAIMQAGFGWELDGGGINIFTNTTMTVETPVNFATQVPPFGLSSCGFVIPPGGNLTFRVQPVIRMQNGTFQGDLTINSFFFDLTGTTFI